MIETITVCVILLGFAIAVFKLKRVLRIFHIFKFKVIYLFLIPALLFSLWVFLSTKEVYRINNVLLQLTSEYTSRNLIDPQYDELTQGERISGEFTSRDNYLGIVSVRFWNFNQLNDDYAIFRIREQGQSEWYYENSHKVDQFPANGLFTFGFPIVNDSLGKKYYFEVESTMGSAGNAVGLSEIEPVFTTTFKYPREFVLASGKNMAKFLERKVVQLFYTPRFVGSSFIFMLPLLLYLLFLHFKFVRTRAETLIRNLQSKAEKFKEDIANQKTPTSPSVYLKYVVVSSRIYILSNDKRASYHASLLLIFVALFVDIFLIRKSDLTMMILLMLWGFLAILYKMHLQKSYLLALILFIVSFFAWNLGGVNNQFIAERALGWSLLFVSFATLQTLDGHDEEAFTIA